MSDAGTVLITGVTGFVGGALARRLVADGVRVVGLVRGSHATGLAADGVEYVALDQFDERTLAEVFSAVRPDTVFHLAAAGVQGGPPDFDALYQGNVDYSVAVVRALGRVGHGRLIYSGSCFEYRASEAPLDESAPIGPFSLYGGTKAAAGFLVQSLAQSLSVRLTTVRLFGIYGPGEAATRLPSFLIRGLLNHESIALTSGRQVRDLLFIEDVVDALIAVLTSEESILNICSGNPVSVRELAQTAAKLLDRPETLLQWGAKPDRREEPARIIGDPRRLQRACNWRPRVSLEQGLLRLTQVVAPHWQRPVLLSA